MRPAALSVSGVVLMVSAMLPVVLATPAGGGSMLSATLVLAHALLVVVFAPAIVDGKAPELLAGLVVLVTGPWPLMALAVQVSDVPLLALLAGEAVVALAAAVLLLAAWRSQQVGGQVSWARLAPPVLQSGGLGVLLATWPGWSPWLGS